MGEQLERLTQLLQQADNKATLCEVHYDDGFC